MIKDDLIFDWKPSESHGGRYLLAAFLVILLFVGVSGLIRVKVTSDFTEIGKSASVIQLRDDETGRRWFLEAEEAGPFPGGISRQAGDFLDLAEGAGNSFVAVEWGGYESTPLPFLEAEKPAREEIAQKGLRVLPYRSPSKPDADVTDSPVAVIRRVPTLVPFDSSSAEAIPKILPPFNVALAEDVNPANWRFAISCRADGSVDQCLTLSGEYGESLAAMTHWLRSVRFNTGNEERWIALRVEFVNQMSDGP